MSKEDVDAWLKEVIPDEYDASLARPTGDAAVPNASKAKLCDSCLGQRARENVKAPQFAHGGRKKMLSSSWMI